MFRRRGISVSIFVLLFITVLIELVYLFFYSPNLRFNSKKIPFSSQIIEEADVIPSTILNISQVEQIVLDVKKNKISSTSYLNELNSLIESPAGSKFQLENKKNNWVARSLHTQPSVYENLILIKLLFNSKNGPSGITLNGYSPQESATENIFFGIGEDGKKLYIDAKTKSIAPTILYSRLLKKKLEGIYILFSKKGTSFLVTDLSFNKITYVDMKKITDKRFANGLFPRNYFYIGYALAPKSDLTVSEFSVLLTK